MTNSMTVLSIILFLIVIVYEFDN